MTAPQATGTVVWQRTVERALQRRRWMRMLLWFVAPAVAVAIVMAVALGTGALLGWAIVAGVFGLLLAARIAVKNLTERTNATIRFDGTHLLWGQRRIAVADVASYSTYSRRMAFVSPSGFQFGRARERFASATGFALFRLADGSVTTFMWPSMSDDQVDGVRAALDPLLPGRWEPTTES